MKRQTVLIIGGVGFIGSNLARYYIKKGENVIVFDNLSRPGVKSNINWLKQQGEVTFVKRDVADYFTLKQLFGKFKIDVIFHQAAQVAVTTAVKNPRKDFGWLPKVSPQIGLKKLYDWLQENRSLYS